LKIHNSAFNKTQNGIAEPSDLYEKHSPNISADNTYNVYHGWGWDSVAQGSSAQLSADPIAACSAADWKRMAGVAA